MLKFPIKRELYNYSKKLIEENNFGQRGKDDGSPKEPFEELLKKINEIVDWINSQ